MSEYLRKIVVTADDILNGVRECSDCCPIALAIKRAMPGAKVNVESADSIIIEPQDTYSSTWAALDEVTVEEFITSFDIGDGVEPLEIEIEPLDEEEVRYYAILAEEKRKEAARNADSTKEKK